MTARVADGQELWGQDSRDGWFPRDGTTFVSDKGQSERGLTKHDGPLRFLSEDGTSWLPPCPVSGNSDAHGLGSLFHRLLAARSVLLGSAPSPQTLTAGPMAVMLRAAFTSQSWNAPQLHLQVRTLNGSHPC